MDTKELIERLERAIKAAKGSNCNSSDVEDNLQEIVDYLRTTIYDSED